MITVSAISYYLYATSYLILMVGILWSIIKPQWNLSRINKSQVIKEQREIILNLMKALYGE